MLLQDKVAIVTAGGGPGIGSSIVRKLAEEGARIAVVDVDLERATSVAKEVTAGGGQAIAVRTDVSNEIEVREAVNQTISAFGDINILINHAGMNDPERIETMTTEQWRRICAVNLDSVFYFTRAVIPSMKNTGWGRIVSTSSRVAYRTSKSSYERGMAAYAAAKAGIIGFTRTAAFELGSYAITVNVVSPGFTRAHESAQENGQPEYEGVLPFRHVRPEEITAAVMYFVGPGSDRTTGQVLHVNSGSYFNA